MRSLGRVIPDLARRSPAPPGVTAQDGLPVFDVPGDAPVITSEAVAAAGNDV